MVEPEKLTLKKLFPEIIVGGIDYSLITHREANFFQIYGSLREEFSQKYPNPHPEDEEDTFVNEKAKLDQKADLFRENLLKVKAVFDKIDKLKMLATDYEIACTRFYCKYVLNRMCSVKGKKRRQEVKQFVDAFMDSDVYEIVESYFKVMRKYGLPVHEEPYYFLTPKRRREIEYAGEMLKRSTMFDDNEIKISLLEELTSTKS